MTFTRKVLMIASKPTIKPKLSDYRLAISGDSTGVHISILCKGNPVTQFNLLRSDYAPWKRMTPDQQYIFVRTKLPDNYFDDNITNAIVSAICDILNDMFAEGKRLQHVQHRR
jgi:hypothetical protein